ncbi:MAG: RNA methyltransferase [Daejeonella sp.]|uniref:TrmH family RNA methyltransferase n=1 Tax=Daejeonella sp. TaxID=2805397 RepID=UPI002736432A|nr:RNA methyltransferase [Daejeonella sp.]MDP3470105.1 RNA methyltransferase [Daejeonella sp.]
MISKSQISFIKSLHQKKIRKEQGLFIVEGLKSIQEFINSDYVVDSVYYTENLMPKLGNLSRNIKSVEISEVELSKISTLSTPQAILAVVRIPQQTDFNSIIHTRSFLIALDGIQDPGNLGTIIRTADWFGLYTVLCSKDTADAYNPKVVQASMGSLSRVNVIYTELGDFLDQTNLPVYGALLDGNSIYKTDFGQEGIILLGNEGNGISDELQSKINYPVTIPRYGKAESLNVAISAAIFCSELRRKS